MAIVYDMGMFVKRKSFTKELDRSQTIGAFLELLNKLFKGEKMKTTKTLITLFLLAVGLASAQQYSYTFTAPAGATHCSFLSPYTQWYSNLVEHSTPPYPNPLEPGNFQMPAYPNHPIPVLYGCDNWNGFVSATGATANLQLGGPTGNVGGWLRIFSGNTTQAVQITNAIWTVIPTTYPVEGQSVPFTMQAQIVAVCNQICVAASGQLNLVTHFHFNWKSALVHGCRSCGSWNEIYKDWSDDDAEIDGLSTVAILDEDRIKREGYLELAVVVLDPKRVVLA